MRLRFQFRTVLFYFVLLLGNFSGVSMLPKDIEESLHSHNQAKVEESRSDSEDDDDDEELNHSQRAMKE